MYSVGGCASEVAPLQSDCYTGAAPLLLLIHSHNEFQMYTHVHVHVHVASTCTPHIIKMI